MSSLGEHFHHCVLRVLVDRVVPEALPQVLLNNLSADSFQGRPAACSSKKNDVFFSHKRSFTPAAPVRQGHNISSRVDDANILVGRHTVRETSDNRAFGPGEVKTGVLALDEAPRQRAVLNADGKILTTASNEKPRSLRDDLSSSKLQTLLPCGTAT